MRAELKFDLDTQEDKEAHMRAIKSLDLVLLLDDINLLLRGYRKYSNLTPDQDKLFNEIDDKVRNLFNDRNVNLEELMS